MTTLDDAREGMDLSIRAQDDLFGHVNGTWLREYEIPADKASAGAFTVLVDEAEAQVREIIEGAPEGSRIGDLYASFMDTAAVDAAGVEPIKPLVAAVEGLRDVGDLAAFLGEFERIGGHGLFGGYVNTDDKDSSRYIFNLLQGGLGLPDESYYRDEKFAEIREKYVDYLTRLFELGGVAEARTAAETVLAIDTKIALGHWERAETRDRQKTYNLMTLAELRSLAPAFDWDAYVTNLSGAKLAADAVLGEVVVRQPSFFSHLSGVLEETPVEEWRSWLLAHVLRWSAAYLTDDFVETNFDFYGRTLNGTPELRERWKRGVALVEGVVGEEVGETYVARHFPPASKAMMDELVANLLAAYRVSIEALDWMSEETKQRAFTKLEKFTPKIGYPKTFRDYSALVVRRDDLIANVQAASVFETDRQLGKLGGPVDRDEWHMLPQTVNAYYNPGTNEICFPAGILQKPFFSPEATLAENYGGIGAVIGHEIGHGFDDQGSQYDGDGNMENWWTDADRAAFEVKTKALIEQYDGFELRDLPGEKVNGSLTVGENIGDLGGLTIAYKAFLLAQPDATDDDKRSLFLNWSYVWRGKRRPEQLQQLLAVDPHSPAEFRANIVRNLNEFHELFETTESDALWLDPEARVGIW
ncbi:M13 family metallopeptidase [Nocardioides nematodiphilus]|uniref:M13 family metallopeptidase n=1 Tax=Nocardioides nematodiphilus TaxID=2849669 RepID=UPI0027E2164D|nr:M13-type metalloendopeptidase [Nocardioides nematodiphilus]